MKNQVFFKKSDETFPIDTPEHRKKQHAQNSKALALSPQNPNSKLKLLQEFVKQIIGKEKNQYASSKKTSSKDRKT